jgi:glycosyltransferase involved in cell wall biosynthesis
MRQEALKIAPAIAQKHRKIPGGVDIGRFKPAEDKMAVRRELSLPEDKIILLTVRRLATRMGLENLIQAMAIVEKERADVMLLIGGQGEIKEKLQQLIRDLGLQRTTMTGYIAYDSELPKYYQASDLFVMPSITLEGFGLSTVEALACGVPVVGTSTGGTPEILNEVLPDFIFANTEPQTIAEGILGLLDSVRGEGIKTKVREYAENHSWKNITDSFESLFQEVAAVQ